MRWSIQNDQIFTTIWEVEADSQEEALRLFHSGEAECVDNYDDEFVDIWPADD